MKGTFTAAAILVAISAIPVTLAAKENTLKITLSGGNLATPVEITDPKILDNFNVWTGPGTSSNAPEGFIVQWSRGATAEPPSRLSQYLVSFYTERLAERPFYVVSYCYDPSRQRGYVYFPGFGEKWYSQDVGTIFRGVEGDWFLSRPVWDTTIEPLIAKASECDARELVNPIKPDDPIYSEAMDLAEVLRHHGLAIKCVLPSKRVNAFEGQVGAALYRTNRGDFEALILKKPATFASVKPTEAHENEFYLYSFEGRPPARGGWTSSRREYFVKHRSQMLVTREEQLAVYLDKALNSY
jgi:hypothetical protein